VVSELKSGRGATGRLLLQMPWDTTAPRPRGGRAERARSALAQRYERHDDAAAGAAEGAAAAGAVAAEGANYGNPMPRAPPAAGEETAAYSPDGGDEVMQNAGDQVGVCADAEPRQGVEPRPGRRRARSASPSPSSQPLPSRPRRSCRGAAPPATAQQPPPAPAQPAQQAAAPRTQEDDSPPPSQPRPRRSRPFHPRLFWPIIMSTCCP